jgi:HK97 family phage portal protein
MPWQWPWRRRTEDRQLWNVGDIPMPSTYAGVGVNADSAMRLSAVWACVRLLADCVSTLPVDVYRQGDATPMATLPPLLAQPAADADLCDWLYMLMASLLLRGNGYGNITARTGAGLLPAQVDLAHPDFVVPPNITDPPQQRVYRINGVEYEPADVFHVRAYRMPGSLVGLSPVTYAKQAIGLGLAAEKYGAKFFGDSAIPSGVLTTAESINQTVADTLKERWNFKFQDSREIAVLGHGATFQPITVSPEESQFLDTTKANVATICRFYGVPPEMVAGETAGHMAYTSPEQRSTDLLVYAIRPWLVRLERAISRLLPRNQTVKFNADAIVRVTLLDRYQAHAAGIAAGFLTVNEARQLEDLPPLAQGGAVA